MIFPGLHQEFRDVLVVNLAAEGLGVRLLQRHGPSGHLVIKRLLVIDSAHFVEIVS